MSRSTTEPAPGALARGPAKAEDIEAVRRMLAEVAIRAQRAPRSATARHRPAFEPLLTLRGRPSPRC